MCVFFRLTLLELISAQLSGGESLDSGIPPGVARFLASSFQKGCGAVLSLATGSASSDEVQYVRYPYTNATQTFDMKYHRKPVVADCIRRCNSPQVLQEALTVISLLDVLCEMTSHQGQFMFLQDHPDLLVTTVGKSNIKNNNLPLVT